MSTISAFARCWMLSVSALPFCDPPAADSYLSGVQSRSPSESLRPSILFCGQRRPKKDRNSTWTFTATVRASEARMGNIPSSARPNKGKQL